RGRAPAPPAGAPAARPGRPRRWRFACAWVLPKPALEQGTAVPRSPGGLLRSDGPRGRGAAAKAGGEEDRRADPAAGAGAGEAGLGAGGAAAAQGAAGDLG